MSFNNIYFVYANTHYIFYISTDRLISAEIRDQTADPLAYDTVTKFMVHGPCVSFLIDGKCSKLYLKRFCNQTTFDEHGIALCRRRQNL